MLCHVLWDRPENTHMDAIALFTPVNICHHWLLSLRPPALRSSQLHEKTGYTDLFVGFFFITETNHVT